MHLKQIKRNGRVYLSIVENYREQGKVKSRTVETIGYADDYARLYDDPIAHFKAYAANLTAAQRDGTRPLNLSFDPSDRIAAGHGDSIHLGAAVCLAYLDALGCKAFFDRQAKSDGHGLPLSRTFGFFASERMMHAVPKHQSWEQREAFPRSCPDSYADAYRCLERIGECDRDFVRQLNRSYERLQPGRPKDCGVLVLSNYLFAVSYENDPSQAFDSRAEAPRYMRLCLLLDGEGMPLSYRLSPERVSFAELCDVIDAEKREHGLGRIVVVARQLPTGSRGMRGLADRGDGFVTLKDLRDAPEQTRAWIGCDQGYRSDETSGFPVKSRTVPWAAGAGEPGPQALAKEVAVRPRGSRAQALCLVTSETSRSDRSVLDLYRELWRVHEPFQLIDADLISPPWPLSARAHTRAHFIICYTAFFALRFMRRRSGWRYNAAQMADALLQMKGARLDGNWFLFNYRTRVSDSIELAAGIEPAKRIRSRQDVRSCIARIAAGLQAGCTEAGRDEGQHTAKGDRT